MNGDSTHNLPVIVAAAIAALIGFTVVFVLIAALVMIAVGNTEEAAAEPVVEAVAEAITEAHFANPEATAEVALESALETAHSAATLQTGEEIFTLRCSPCHGPDGEGTIIAPSFVDFVVMPYEFVEVRVRSGPEIMSAFTEDEINAEQLAALVTYLEENIVGTQVPAFTEADIEQGREYWRDYCRECHGSFGQGKDDYGPALIVWPPYSISRVIKGARIPLPGMPRIPISDEELVLVAGYLQSLARP